MDAKVYLKDYIARADECLDSFFARKISEVSDIGTPGKGVSIAQDMLTRYREFSHGGKKLRGALIQLGFEIAGGDKTKVLAASTSIEIIHSFLLMHDDIMDKDALRRGRPTMHEQYKSSYGEHYGLSMGINTGDLGAYLGMEILLNADISDSEKIKAALYLSRLLQRVAFGQGLDVTYEQLGEVGEADVLQVHLHKTAIYTISGPLKIGALLGGLDTKKIAAIEQFGRLVGVAFQLRDDELGLYSDEETLGKPIGSDIKEGKNTLLRVIALKNAAAGDRKFLNYAYGNAEITKEDVKKVQEITKTTGSLDYSQKLSQKLVADGKKFVSQITDNPEHRETLNLMADFMITRES